MKPRRPYRVTIPGGRCVGTYSTPERAYLRAEQLLMTGKGTEFWIRHRRTGVWRRVTSRAT